MRRHSSCPEANGTKPSSAVTDRKLEDRNFFGATPFLTVSRLGLSDLFAAESEGSVKPEHSMIFRAAKLKDGWHFSDGESLRLKIAPQEHIRFWVRRTCSPSLLTTFDGLQSTREASGSTDSNSR